MSDKVGEGSPADVASPRPADLVVSSQQHPEAIVQSAIFRHYDIDASDASSTPSTDAAMAFADSVKRSLGIINILNAFHAAAVSTSITREQYLDLRAMLMQEADATCDEANAKRVKEALSRLPVPEAVSGIDDPSYNTAVVICPPEALSRVVQKIRQEHDKSHVDLWPAHITLFYPFVHPQRLKEFVPAVQAACAGLEPFELNLDSFGSFNQGKQKGFVSFLEPTPSGPVRSLHASVASALTSNESGTPPLSAGLAKALGKPLKQAHMTVGRGQERPVAPILEKKWEHQAFTVDKLFVLQREHNKSPMKVVDTIPLGRATEPNGEESAPATDQPSNEAKRALVKHVEASAQRGELTWSRAHQLRKAILFPAVPATAVDRRGGAAMDGPDPDLFSLAAECEVAQGVFGDTCVSSSLLQEATSGEDGPAEVTITLSYVHDGADRTITVDFDCVLGEGHPIDAPSTTILRTEGMVGRNGSSINMTDVLQQAVDVFTQEWMQERATIGQRPYYGMYVMGVFELIGEIVHGEIMLAMHKTTASADDQAGDAVVGITKSPDSLLSFRPMTTALEEEESESKVGIKDADHVILSAVLKHLKDACGSVVDGFRLAHVENIIHPRVLEKYNLLVEQNVLASNEEVKRARKEKDGNRAEVNEYREGIKKISPAEQRCDDRDLRERRRVPYRSDRVKEFKDDVLRFAPLLAFHGTSSVAKGLSIANDGLKSAGEYTSDGVLIQQCTGSVMGPGAYVSPSFTKSFWYSYGDSNAHFQMIAGVAVPGKCRKFSYDAIQHLRRNKYAIHDIDCDSHLSPDGQELILYNSSAFLPVLSLSFAPKHYFNVKEEAKLAGSVAKLARGSGFNVTAHLVTLPRRLECASEAPSREQTQAKTQAQAKTPGASKRDRSNSSQATAAKSSSPASANNRPYHKLYETFGPEVKRDVDHQLNEELWMVEIPPELAHASSTSYGSSYLQSANVRETHGLIVVECALNIAKQQKMQEYLKSLANGVDILVRQGSFQSVSILLHSAGRVLEKTKELSPRAASTQFASLMKALITDIQSGASRVAETRSSGAMSLGGTIERLCSTVEAKKCGRVQEQCFILAEQWLLYDIYNALPATKKESRPAAVTDQRCISIIQQSSLSRKTRDIVASQFSKLSHEEELALGAIDLKAFLPKKTYATLLQKRVDLLMGALSPTTTHAVVCFLPPCIKDIGTVSLFSDDADLERLHGRMQNSGLKTLLVVVKSGKMDARVHAASSVQPYLRFKLAFQTLSLFEPEAFYHALRPALIAHAALNAARFLRVAAKDQRVTLDCGFEGSSLYTGFLASLVQSPLPSITLSTITATSGIANGRTSALGQQLSGGGTNVSSASRSRNNQPLFCFYRGRPPRTLHVNQLCAPVTLVARGALFERLEREGKRKVKVSKASKAALERKDDAAATRSGTNQAGSNGDSNNTAADSDADSDAEEEEFVPVPHTSAEVQTAIIATLDNFVSQLKELVAHKHSAVQRAICVVSDIVKTLLAEQERDDIDMKRLGVEDRVAIVSARHVNMLRLQSCLNTLYHMAALETEQKELPVNASWLVLSKDMKHGMRALKRAKVVPQSQLSSTSASRLGRLPLATTMLINLRKALQAQPQTNSLLQGDVSAESGLSTADHLEQMRAFCETLSSFLPNPLVEKAQEEVISGHAVSRQRGGKGNKRAKDKAVAVKQKLYQKLPRLPFTPTQLLYAVGIPGLKICVTRSEAASINPWEIKINRVSFEFSDTASAMCALDAGMPLRGSADGNEYNAVLPLTHPSLTSLSLICNTRLLKMYTAVVITRNPLLIIPQQRLALLCAAVSQLMAQFMHKATRPDGSQMRVFFRILLDIVLELQSRQKGVVGSWQEMVQKLMKPMPGRFLTEAEEDGVLSINQVLCALLVLIEGVGASGVLSSSVHRGTHADSDAPSIRTKSSLLERTESMVAHDEDVENAALAVLAECVSRGVRVQVKQRAYAKAKTEEMSELTLLRHTLGIAPDDFVRPQPDDEPEPAELVHKSGYDAEKAKLRSGKFFRKQWTNCAPTAVVGVFGLVNILHAHLDGIRSAMAGPSEGEATAQGANEAADKLMKLHIFSDDDGDSDDNDGDAGNSKISTSAKHRNGGSEDGSDGSRDQPKEKAADYGPALLRAERGVFEFLCSDAPEATRTIEQIAAEFNTISMASFAATYTSDDCDAWDLQIALYVQAIRFHSSKTRRRGLPSLRNPKQVIVDAAVDVRTKLYQAELKKKMDRVRARMAQESRVSRRNYFLFQQHDFLQTHGDLPKTFSHEEVNAMNIERPADDQIVLTPSGLPRHRCAHVNCPLYLENLATSRDIALNTRHGLYKHLALLMYPEPEYIPNFHNFVKHYHMGQWQNRKKEFVETATTAYVSKRSGVTRAHQKTLRSLLAMHWDNTSSAKSGL